MSEKALRAGEYYGRVASAAEVAGLRLTDLEHASARRIPSHSHEQAFLCLLLGGRYRERAGRLAVEYAPGTLVFHPAGLQHEDEIGPGGGEFFLVGAYARRLKVQRVFEQLAEGERSLAEIAFDAGFTDQSHLTRVFGRVAGRPPGALRRLLRR